MRVQALNVAVRDARMRYRLCARARMRRLERRVYGFGAREGSAPRPRIYPAERSEYRIDRYIDPRTDIRCTLHEIYHRTGVTSVTSALYANRGPKRRLRMLNWTIRYATRPDR